METLHDNFPTYSVVFLVNFLNVLGSIGQIYFIKGPHHWLVGKSQQANEAFAAKFYPNQAKCISKTFRKPLKLRLLYGFWINTFTTEKKYMYRAIQNRFTKYQRKNLDLCLFSIKYN